MNIYRENNWVIILVMCFLGFSSIVQLFSLSGVHSFFGLYISLTIFLGIFIGCDLIVEIAFQEEKKKLIIRFHPLNLYVTELLLSNIKSIDIVEGGPSRNWAYNPKGFLGTFDSKEYPNKIRICYSDQENEKVLDLCVKHPDRLYSWLKSQLCGNQKLFNDKPDDAPKKEINGDLVKEDDCSQQSSYMFRFWKVLTQTAATGMFMSAFVFFWSNDTEILKWTFWVLIPAGVLIILGTYNLRQFDQGNAISQ